MYISDKPTLQSMVSKFALSEHGDHNISNRIHQNQDVEATESTVTGQKLFFVC